MCKEINIASHCDDIKITAPIACENLNNQGKCPLLDVRERVNPKSLKRFVEVFTAWYYGISIRDIKKYQDFLYLEKIYYAREDGCAVEEVEYGRIFINENGEGGMSDKGLTVYFLLNGLTDAMGIHLNAPDEDVILNINDLSNYLIERLQNEGLIYDENPSSSCVETGFQLCKTNQRA